MVCYLKDSTFGFAHHRGITHTFIGIPFVAAAVLLLVWILDQLRQRFRKKQESARLARLHRRNLPDKPRWSILYALAILGCLAHILLDYTNQYGVRPFEPFSYHWYAWDIVFIFEPLLYIFLIGGLVLPGLFALINEEIGSRSRKPRGTAGAIVALVLMVSLWGFRDFQHRRALAAINSRVYRGEDALLASAFPYPTNPFRWVGVVETEDFFDNFEVNSGEVDPKDRAVIRYKPEETPITLAAKSSHLGRVYLDWARYPLIEVESFDEPVKHYLVRFSDLRFVYPEESRRPLRATVALDKDLRIIDEWWGEKKEE
jgi:inner membrane protein